MRPDEYDSNELARLRVRREAAVAALRSDEYFLLWSRRVVVLLVWPITLAIVVRNLVGPYGWGWKLGVLLAYGLVMLLFHVWALPSRARSVARRRAEFNRVHEEWEQAHGRLGGGA